MTPSVGTELVNWSLAPDAERSELLTRTSSRT